MSKHLIISNSTDLLRILPCNILCIKADGNYSVIYTTDGDQIMVLFQLGMISKKIDQQLGDDAGMLAHISRGLIINEDYVYTINTRKQQLCLRSPQGKSVKFEVPKDALKELKENIESQIGKDQQ